MTSFVLTDEEFHMLYTIVTVSERVDWDAYDRFRERVLVEGHLRYAQPISPRALLEMAHLAGLFTDYRIDVSADGLEERLVRPDGSIAVVAKGSEPPMLSVFGDGR